MPRQLTERQRIFAREYAQHGNGTVAARRAGYSARTARSIASENLTKPDIRRAVEDEKVRQSKENAEVSQQYFQHLCEAVEADIAGLFDSDGTLRHPSDWPAIFRRGLVKAVEFTSKVIVDNDGERVVLIPKKIVFADRHRYLVTLGRHNRINAFRQAPPVQADIDDPIKVRRAQVMGRAIRPEK